MERIQDRVEVAEETVEAEVVGTRAEEVMALTRTSSEARVPTADLAHVAAEAEILRVAETLRTN